MDVGRFAERLFKRVPLDNRLTPPNPIALKCSSRAHVHELVLLSPLSASSRKEERERGGGGKEGGRTDRTRARSAARLVRVGKVREFIEVSLIPRG